MNNTKNNVVIKINQKKYIIDVIKELAMTFLEGTRRFYSNPKNVQKFKEWQEKRHKEQLNQN